MPKKRGGKAQTRKVRKWQNLTPARLTLLERVLRQLLSEYVQKDKGVVLGKSGGHSELGDCSQSAINTDLQIRQVERASERREKIVAALQRIEKDKYGICPECEQPIDPERLHKHPEVEFCTSCQSEQDEEEERAGRLRQLKKF